MAGLPPVAVDKALNSDFPVLSKRSSMMRMRSLKWAVAVIFMLGVNECVKADEYTIDTAHSGVTFHISHLNLSNVYGRFDSFTGGFTLDSSDPSRSSFKLTIKTDSVDTNNTARDNHLRSPDFFNAKQFPSISFTSTSVKPIEGGYDVIGDLTLHGETKPVSFSLKGGGSAEFPKGVRRTGFSTDFVVKRSDFGVGRPMPILGDEVHVSIGFEGTKKR
jgi:polyisoprenoid-binding protein YceI